jgi:hypothetical protein
MIRAPDAAAPTAKVRAPASEVAAHGGLDGGDAAAAPQPASDVRATQSTGDGNSNGRQRPA